MGRMKNERSRTMITLEDMSWEVASKIIGTGFFTFDEMRKIGEHLINYCATEEVKK
jgi:hypothetical protein